MPSPPRVPSHVKPKSCTGCSLQARGHGFVPPDGPTNAPILWVGEAPGYDEAAMGRPFIGAAGSMFERILRRNRLNRGSFRVGNVLQCVPPGMLLEGQGYQHTAIAHCQVHRDAVLNEGHQVVMAAGSTALKTLLGLHGAERIRVEEFHGTVHRDRDDRFWIVPTFHPSFLQRGAHNLMGTVSFDLQVALELVAGTWTHDPLDLVIDPPPDWFATYVEMAEAAAAQDPGAIAIASDIETPDKAGGKPENELTPDDTSYQITRYNFAINGEQGVTVPNDPAYHPWIQRLLELPCYHYWWNGYGYDWARIWAAGYRPDPRWQLDLMLGAHVLQSDVPLGLGFWAPFYCLAAGTRVQLWDGTTRKVSDLVTKREQVDLLGMDDAGRPVPLKIKEWFRAESPNQSWLSVTVQNGKQPIYCTPEHRVWTQDGWKLAHDLQVGDQVPLPRPGHNSLIHGTLLGDGYIDKSGYLVFAHCAAQEAWLRAKAQVFHTGVTIQPTVAKGGYKPGAEGWRCGVKNVGQAWRPRFYTGRTKQFLPPPDAAALAVWYGDDGCLAHTGLSYNPRISIAGFNNIPEVYRWFQREFRASCVSEYSSGTHAEQVALIGSAPAAFFARIAPWLHPSMSYKLPPQWRGRYNGWMDRPYFQTGVVEQVIPWIPKAWHRRKAIRYCVEVDHPTHRYFTSGGLVSNSRYGAWKHRSATDPEAYACIDGPQTHRVGVGILGDLLAEGQWRAFHDDCHELYHTALKPAQDVGILIDRPALEAFHEDLATKQRRLLHEIQGCVPDTLRPLTGETKAAPEEGLLHPAARTANLRTGEALKEQPDPLKQELYALTALRVERNVSRLIQVCVACGTAEVHKKHRCKRADGKIDRDRTPQIELQERLVVRYFWQEPFNPDSSKQMLGYLRHKGHKPGKNKKTKEDSADRETLLRLAKSTKDPFYTFNLDYRAVKKVDSTYAVPTLRRIAQDPEGRLHPIPTFRPSTMRLSYVSPNITNVVQDKGGKANLAAGFRRCVVAGPGCHLLEVDYSGIEAVETGWFSRDPAYIRLAKLGVHAYLASHLLGRPADLQWSDADLLAYFTDLKKANPLVYDQAKRCVHGTNYGLTPYGMTNTFPDLYPEEAVAKRVQGLYFEVCPGLPVWHGALRQRAYDLGCLGGAGQVTLAETNACYHPTWKGPHPWAHPFAYRHWFWSVLAYRPISEAQRLRLMKAHQPVEQINGRWFALKWGEDGKRVIAFYPQSTAAGVLKRTIRALFSNPAHPSYIGDAYFGRTPLRAPIHDSLLLEIPDRVWDSVCEKIFREMQRPVVEQPLPASWGMGSHLQIGVEAKAGANWLDVEKIQVPGWAELGDVKETYWGVEETDEEEAMEMGVVA